ncbi:substrate-binding periplasmic protein [Maridesulfovibrio sp.]|uniref:substrate-binding periplasmic protein n=1 Tax=Maridesulfovibrio sp. TaxID=2795000 RepID=UPI003BAA451C
MNLKQKIFIIIAACLMLLLSCGPAKAGSVVSFATQDFYPFSYKKDGKIVGPGAEIIRTTCKNINTDCTLCIQPWRRSVAMAQKGLTHAIFMVGWNKERTEWLTFSPAIIKTEYGFFECSDVPLTYTGPKSLIGKTIGVYGPSNTSHQLEQLAKEAGGHVRITLTPDALTQFKRLSRCRVDAVYSNREVGQALIREIKAKNIKYNSQKKLNYYIAFPKKYVSTGFVKKFSREIKRMKESGELKKILDKYHMQMAD